MIALLQRASQASVTIAAKRVAEMGSGVVALIGVEREDTPAKADRLLQRIVNYRMFSDDNGRMNCSVHDVQGGIILVSQFTLIADTQKGNRPGFSRGASPELGQEMFSYMVAQARQQYPFYIGCGEFAADMQVALVNNGPVTFWLQV